MLYKAISDLKDLLSWSDRIGSDETNEINNIIKNLETVRNHCIIWSIEDFKAAAIEKRGDSWRDYYDESKFEEALERMIRKHDANIGICWETVKIYLDEYCMKEKEGDSYNFGITYVGNDEENYTLLHNNISVATIHTGEDGVLALISDINKMISNFIYENTVIEIKNDDGLLGIIVDIWEKGAEEDEPIATQCFWFEDYIN